MIQCVRLAGGTGHHERLGASGELVVYQRAERRQIESIAAERRGQGTNAATKFLQDELRFYLGRTMLLAGEGRGKYSHGNTGMAPAASMQTQAREPHALTDTVPRPTAN